MSRRFSIGFVAALALLVSAGPALGGVYGKRENGKQVCFAKVISNEGTFCGLVAPTNEKGWATFPSSLRGPKAPLAMVIMPDPGIRPCTFESHTKPHADGLLLD